MVFLKDIHRTDISGFLGNRLFQLLSAYNLARKNGDILCLPTGFQERDFFENDFFDLASEFFIRENIQNQYDEPYFQYKEIPYKENLNLNGYYQSWKYFDGLNVKELLKPKLEFKNLILQTFNNDYGLTYDELFAYKRVTAIHRRSGDYLNFQHVFTNLFNTDYYEKAIEKLDEKTDYFLIFSNNIPECRERFKGDKFLFSNTIQEKSQGNNSSAFDLYLMSMCNNFITANSTFSWMGSYLGDSLKKKVIMPKNWFVNNLHDTKDLYPDGTILI
jgi:glycosyl transferase family 11